MGTLIIDCIVNSEIADSKYRLIEMVLSSRLPSIWACDLHAQKVNCDAEP